MRGGGAGCKVGDRYEGRAQCGGQKGRDGWNGLGRCPEKMTEKITEKMNEKMTEKLCHVDLFIPWTDIDLTVHTLFHTPGRAPSSTSFSASKAAWRQRCASWRHMPLLPRPM